MKRGLFLLIILLFPIVCASFVEDFKNGLINDLPILEENKYSFVIVTMLIISVIVSINYKINFKGKTKDIKDSHLFNEAIETLGSSEKDICKILNETEGVTEDYLSEKTDKDKIKIKNSLKLLEKRQIIKERKDENSKIYLSDWLK